MFELPKLKYEYNALEPYIDAKTMEIHHTKHHAGYTNKLNDAISGADFEGKSIEEILSSPDLPIAIRNNGGGFYNHSLFWEIMSPNGGGEPTGKLMEEINKAFGTFEKFKEEFGNAAATRFGSGWAWLVKTDEGLKITSTPNQDNPLMDNVDPASGGASVKGVPILALDVWEHAYYLNYQNRRPDYIQAFWNVVDWDKVSELYEG